MKCHLNYPLSLVNLSRKPTPQVSYHFAEPEPILVTTSNLTREEQQVGSYLGFIAPLTSIGKIRVIKSKKKEFLSPPG